MLQDRGEAASSAVAALKAQIELLEDEWRCGMERDTLVLLDRACARLAALEEEEEAAAAAAPAEAG